MGNFSYGIDVEPAIEVIPLVKLKELTGMPRYVLGIFDYHGQLIPAIDIVDLTTGVPAKKVLSTRMVLLKMKIFNSDELIIGLVAEKMTTILDCDEADLEDIRMVSPDAPYLGKVLQRDNHYLQVIDLDKLLNKELQDKLFKHTQSETQR